MPFLSLQSLTLTNNIDSYVIDEGTAGQPVYDDGEMGEGEGGEEEDIPDDSVMGFLEHTDSVYCISFLPPPPLLLPSPFPLPHSHSSFLPHLVIFYLLYHYIF